MLRSSDLAASLVANPVGRPETTTNVVLIVRDRLLLEALPESRRSLAGVTFVGRTMDVAAARDLITQTSPQIVLLDGPSYCSAFRMLAEHLAVRLHKTRVAVFVDDFSDAQLDLALAGGASGLLSRLESLPELADALTAIARGEVRVARAIQHRIGEDRRTGVPSSRRRTRLRHFSDRQLEVLIHLAEGRRVRDIADQMHLSEKAIESHKYRLMNRLGIHDRVELCRWAIREGLINA